MERSGARELRKVNRMRLKVLLCTVLLATGCTDRPHESAEHSGSSADQSVEQNVDWSVYLGDNGRQHYTPLEQINRNNVLDLEVAWTYDSQPGETRGTMYTSPLVVDGILYALSPSLVPFALNAATGEQIWRTDLDLPGNAQRGLMWWAKGDDRRVFFTAGKELIALNADDGSLVKAFGTEGKLDLTPPVDDRGYIGVTVPGVVFEDMLILGFSTTEGTDAYPGSLRAFSATDGKLIWQFDTIPKPGDVGASTWAEGSLERAGGANAWTAMTLDEQRALLFAPTGSTTPDFYGADRLGDNLFGNSIVAIDARNGSYKWHYQVVKHDLWDKDNPSPPTLVQLKHNGKLIDAVTLTTKTGHLYAFDRESGEPIYPINEIATLPSTLPGEVPASKQYVSSIEIARQKFEVTNRSPQANAYIKQQIKDWDLRPWAPPKVGTVLLYPWYDGGAEWGGSAYEPATRRLIVNANDAAGILTLAEVPIGHSAYSVYLKHCGACHGAKREGTDTGPPLNDLVERLGYEEISTAIDEGRDRMPSFKHLSKIDRDAIYGYILPKQLPPIDKPSTGVGYALTSGYVYLKDHEGLPGNSPPWGTLNSIDLDTGEIVWQVNFGDFLTHPGLGYGAINYGGPVVTASGLIFIGATPDKKFRAYNSDNGEILWETELSAAGFSTPAIYSVSGRQFVVIAAGGGRLGPPSGSEYVAFALPDSQSVND